MSATEPRKMLAEGGTMSGPEFNPADDQPIDREEWERTMKLPNPAAAPSTPAPPDEPRDGKRPMFKVTHSDSGGNFCVFKDWDSVRDAEFDGAEFGDKIIIELVAMTDAEFEALGDFEGW